MKAVPPLFLGILFALTLQRCTLLDSEDWPPGCTREFVMHHVTVLMPDGEPADSVQVKVRSKEAGILYDVCAGSYCSDTAKGIYLVMHDGFLGELSEDKEAVVVEGIRGDLQFSEEYAFRSGPCHVEKLAGVDTVTLASD